LPSADDAIYDFIARATQFAELMAQAGAPVKFHDYYRDEATQNAYFARGASKARWGQSSHNFALGADYHFADHGWNVPKQWWQFGDTIARQVGLVSGIAYGDANHVELPGWRSWKPYFSV